MEDGGGGGAELRGGPVPLLRRRRRRRLPVELVRVKKISYLSLYRFDDGKPLSEKTQREPPACSDRSRVVARIQRGKKNSTLFFDQKKQYSFRLVYV